MENINIATALVVRGLGITPNTDWKISHAKMKYFQDHCKSLGFSFRHSVEGILVYSDDFAEWLRDYIWLLDSSELDNHELKPDVEEWVEKISEFDAEIKTTIVYPDWMHENE